MIAEANYNKTPKADPNGTLVGSRLESTLGVPSKHVPLFDFDVESVLVESRTAGHFHLYINQPISVQHYRNILNAMAAAGLVQQRWVDSLGDNGQVFLRLPVKQAVPGFIPTARFRDTELETEAQKSGAMLSD